MKKIFVAAACLAGALSLSAQACPHGTHPVGGTGPHHKGGTCVANNKAPTHQRHHDAKPAKKQRAEASQHKNAASAPKHERKQHPKRMPADSTVDQAPGRSH